MKQLLGFPFYACTNVAQPSSTIAVHNSPCKNCFSCKGIRSHTISLNGQTPTSRMELLFLDCLIMRNPRTTVYRKPTNTGRYLNFHSCHSSAAKQGFIKGLFLRAERLCSTPGLLKTEMERIYSELWNNLRSEKVH